MAKVSFELEVQPRKVHGKGASRRLRREADLVPAIVYGASEKPESITIGHTSVQKALKHDAFFSHILILSNGGKKQKVVLKDVQRHPYKPRILHLDFLRIDENKPLTMHVPIHFLGEKEGPAVKNEGGTVTHHMVELPIKCLPANLPEAIEIDLSTAEMDTVIHLSHVKLPKGVELLNVIHGPEDDLPVVSVHKPKRVELEEETEAPVGAADVPATAVKTPAAAAPAKGNGKDKGKKK